MSKRKKEKQYTNNYSFEVKIEKLIVQHPDLPSLDSGSEKQIEAQSGINKILKFLLFLSVSFRFGLLQMYMDNWDVIEPVSQLVEWIIIIVKFIVKTK